MALIAMPRIRLGESMATQSGTRFVFNKNDNMGPINLTVGSNTYTLEGYSSDSNLFDMEGGGNPYMYVAYKNGITISDFSSGAELYQFFCNTPMTLTRESDGYGLRWSSGVYAVYGGRTAGFATWNVGSGSAASETTDSRNTIWYNLEAAYNNGENLVMEFTAKA